jgi:hypothetical protein
VEGWPRQTPRREARRTDRCRPRAPGARVPPRELRQDGGHENGSESRRRGDTHATAQTAARGEIFARGLHVGRDPRGVFTEAHAGFSEHCAASGPSHEWSEPGAEARARFRDEAAVG